MAPLLWKAPWRRAKNLCTLSDHGGVEVSLGTKRHGNSQGEHGRSNSSWDDAVSSLSFSATSAAFSLTSSYVYTSTPMTRPSPTSNSTTGTGFLSSPSDDMLANHISESATDSLRLSPAPSSLSSHLHFMSESMTMTSSPEPTARIITSSSLSLSLPTTQRTEPSAELVHLHAILASPPNPEDVTPTLTALTSLNKIPSSTLSSKSTTPFITAVTPSTTSVTSSSPLNPTGSVFSSNDAPSATHVSPIPSVTPQRHGNSKPKPSLPGPRVSLHLDTPTISSPVGVDKIAILTTPSPSPPTNTFITPTVINLTLPSLTSVDGVLTTPLSNLNQFAAVNPVSSTTDLSTPTASSRDVTSFTTTTAVITFSPIQISGSQTSIPVTATVQTVLPTVLPENGKRSIPVAAIVAPLVAIVIFIFLLAAFVFRRGRQRSRRASLDFSAPAPAMRQTEPVQGPALFKEETELPPIPVRPTADPYDNKPLTDEPPRMLAPPLVLPPMPTLNPFADPLALVSTSLDGDGPSRLSAGSIYNEPIARASMSSSDVGYAL